MIDKYTNEFVCDNCGGWHDLPYKYFGTMKVCRKCKEYLEDEVEMQVDKHLLKEV